MKVSIKKTIIPLVLMIAFLFSNTYTTEASTLTELESKYDIELKKGSIINIKDSGATGDGKTDDTASIQKSLNKVSKKKNIVYFPKGEYMINANDSESTEEMVRRFANPDVGLKVSSNTTIVMDEEAYVKVIPNEFYSYTVFNLGDVENVSIYGGNIVGDRNDHLKKYPKLRRGDPEYNGETGWGILMKSSENILIDDINIQDMWGDAIDLFASKESTKPNKDIVIRNSVLSNNRRQGISIENVENLVIENNIIKGTKGTDPSAGVNIEPADFKHHNLRSAKNIKIRNNQFLDNDDAGVLLYGMGTRIFYDKDDAGNQQGAIIDDIEITNNLFKGNNTNHQNVQDGAWKGAYNGQLMIVGASNVVVKNNNLEDPKPLGSMDNTNVKARFEPNSNPTAGILVGYSEGITIEDNAMPKQDVSVINQWSVPETFAYPNSVNIKVKNNEMNEVVKASGEDNNPDVEEEGVTDKSKIGIKADENNKDETHEKDKKDKKDSSEVTEEKDQGFFRSVWNKIKSFFS